MKDPNFEIESDSMGKGQKSLTLPEDLHAKLTSSWERNRTKLSKKYRVSSFSRYAQLLITRGLERDQLECRFEIVNRFEDEVRVRDYLIGKDALIKIHSQSGPQTRLFCELDGTADCQHVGFVLSDVEVLRTAMAERKNKKG